MKKQIIIDFIILFFILLCFIFFLTGCSSEDASLQLKAEKEIEYLEEKIVAMMNSLNQITLSNAVLIEEKKDKSSENTQGGENQKSSSSGGTSEQKEQSSEGSGSASSSSSGSNNSESNKETTKYDIISDSILVNKNQPINWEYIKSNTETIHSTWATLTIDLHGLEVNNEDILNFSNALDQVTLSAKQENKVSTLNNLASLYAFFPSYMKQISDNNEKINVDYTKACVLNSYALADQDKWNEMKPQVENAINYFSNVLNSVSKDKQNQNRLSKIYVLLNELNSSIDVKDKDLYMIKYKNVMEELVNFKHTDES